MTKTDAIKLWDAIIGYADIQYDVGGEGNSGEFHSESEAMHLEKECNARLTVLIDLFAASTKWRPAQKTKPHSDWPSVTVPYWVIEKEGQQ